MKSQATFRLIYFKNLTCFTKCFRIINYIWVLECMLYGKIIFIIDISGPNPYHEKRLPPLKKVLQKLNGVPL